MMVLILPKFWVFVSNLSFGTVKYAAVVLNILRLYYEHKKDRERAITLISILTTTAWLPAINSFLTNVAFPILKHCWIYFLTKNLDTQIKFLINNWLRIAKMYPFLIIMYFHTGLAGKGANSSGKNPLKEE